MEIFNLIVTTDDDKTRGTLNTNDLQIRLHHMLSSLQGPSLHHRTNWGTGSTVKFTMQDSSVGGSQDENKDDTYSSESDPGDHDESKKCQASGAETKDGKNSENAENHKDNNEIDAVNARIVTMEGDENSKNTEKDVVSEINEQTENVINEEVAPEYDAGGSEDSNEGDGNSKNTDAPEDDVDGSENSNEDDTEEIAATGAATTPPAAAIATKKRKLDEAVDGHQTRRSRRSETRK